MGNCCPEPETRLRLQIQPKYDKLMTISDQQTQIKPENTV